jgi:hypothetical protein
MGFWQVYADVIVVADAREQNAEAQNTGKLTFQGLSSELRSLVYSAFSSAIPLFDGRIGIAVLEFIQTMDSEPFTVGTHWLHILHSSVLRAATLKRGTDQMGRWGLLQVSAVKAREREGSVKFSLIFHSDKAGDGPDVHLSLFVEKLWETLRLSPVFLRHSYPEIGPSDLDCRCRRRSRPRHSSTGRT